MQTHPPDFTTEIRRLTAEFEELVAIASEQLNAIEQALDDATLAV